MPIEIDENEYKQLQQIRGIAAAMQKNPRAARLLEQAYKTVDPNARTPLADQDATVNAPFEALQKEISDLKAANAAKDEENERNRKLLSIQNSIDAGMTKLRRAGWQDEGLDGLRKFMEEKGVIDVEVAAAAFERLHPPAEIARPSGSGAWNFIESVGDGEADLKKLIETKGEYNPLVDKMAHEALQGVRQQGR